MTDKTNRGMWRCKQCDAYGTGGVNGFERHYFTNHYIEQIWTADLQGRESSPRYYGEA